MMELQTPPFNPGDVLSTGDTLHFVFYSIELEFDPIYSYYKVIYVYGTYIDMTSITYFRNAWVEVFS